MITIHNFDLKTRMTEYTLKEFQDISGVLNNKTLGNVEKFEKIFELLGMPDEVMYKVTVDEFKTIVEDIYKDGVTNTELTRTIEMNGRLYEAYAEGDEFSLNFKDFAALEKLIKDKPNAYICEAIAIIFKDVDLTKNEHKDPAHIKHKARLFEALCADDYFQYIVYLQTKIVDKFEAQQANVDTE